MSRRKVRISHAGRAHRRPPLRSSRRHRPRHLPRHNRLRPVWGANGERRAPEKTSKLPQCRAGRYVVAVVVSIIARVRAIVAIVGCGLRREPTVSSGRTKNVKTPPIRHGPPRRRPHRRNMWLSRPHHHPHRRSRRYSHHQQRRPSRRSRRRRPSRRSRRRRPRP